VKLSVIVATRNRAHAILGCLDSIAGAFAKAGARPAEIVIVDNGSTDSTAEVIKAWVTANDVPVQSLFEPRTGKGRALNCALRAAQGELFAFTDDDCRLHSDYFNDLLRYAAADTELVLRGGRIELGDPADLPLSITLDPTPSRVNLAMNSARRTYIAGQIMGCNMTMRRALVERLGAFDEDFGPGTRMESGDDTEYMFRAYVSGVTLERVADMTVFHHHGRRTAESGFRLWQAYMIGQGAINAKYLLQHPNLCRCTYWDIKNAVTEIITSTNTFSPQTGFSHRDKVRFAVLGAVRYFFMRKDGVPSDPLSKPCDRANHTGSISQETQPRRVS